MTPRPTRPLTHEQAAVLDLPAGQSAAVIGAPGSGKTEALLAFVVDRAHRDGPGSVVALGPTRATATRLRDEIAARLEVPSPGPLARTVASLAFDIVGHAARLQGVPAPTLLSGGDQDAIIRELLAGDSEAEADEAADHELVGEAGGEVAAALPGAPRPVWPDPLTPTVRALRGFRTELRELLMRATEHRIDTGGLRALGERTQRPEWVAAADFAVRYQGVVDALQLGALDSAELVDFAVAALDRGESSPLIADLRTIVLDDAQEATESTLVLLRALVRRGVAVVAFGDPDLATNAFRGGLPDVLGRLAPRLGLDQVTTLHLGGVHRHGSAIRALVVDITSRIGTAGAGRQHAAVSVFDADAGVGADTEGSGTEGAGTGQSGDAGAVAGTLAETGPPIVRIESDTPAHELAAVARTLREQHLFGGVPWSEMLVVVRNGALVPSVARSLALADVPTRTPVAARAVRDEYGARSLLLAASVATGREPLTPLLATELLGGPLAGFDALSLRRLWLALRAEEIAGGGGRSADELLVEALAAPGRFATIDSRFAARAGRFAVSLDKARVDADTGASIEELIWGLWERSGLATDWSAQSKGHGILAAEADRHLDGVVALFTAAKRFVERSPEAGSRVFLDAILDADVAEDTLSPQALAESVLVATPSAAIGVEADVVVVARLQDGVWPNLRVRGGLLGPDELVEAADPTAVPEAGPVDRRAGVLSDELRMFALSVSRARRQVILSCTANDDETPSMFLRLLPPDVEPTAARPPLSLRGLVGHLRNVATTGDPGGVRVQTAAGALARLAEAGVSGASPDDWYGLLEPTTSAPLVDLEGDPDVRVRVSPSAIESFEECPLHWFIDRFGGTAATTAMGLGTVIHDVMEHATSIERDDLWAEVEKRWGELDFESEWLSAAEKRRARTLTDGLADYLRDFRASGATLLGAESEFTLDTGQATLRGKIDRVEQDRDGRVVIVDLKTGKNAPTAAQTAEHAQLASYQLALAEGAIVGAGGILDGAVESGGAKLVFVSGGVRGKSYREPFQAPFGEAELAAFRLRVETDAAGMAGRTFVARVEEHCQGRFGGSCTIHVVGEVSQ